MDGPIFAPGFRLSAVDVIVLTAGATAAIAFASELPALSLAIGVPVLHFFLFCNVFRISRPPELLWASVFLVLAGGTVAYGMPGWWLTTVLSLGVAIFVIVAEMRKPSYHGMGWRMVNPQLPQWWKNRHGEAPGTEPTDPMDSR